MFIYNRFNHTANNPKPDLEVLYKQQCLGQNYSPKPAFIC